MHKHKRVKMMSARASSVSNKSIRPHYADSQNEVSSVRPRRSRTKQFRPRRSRKRKIPASLVTGEKKTSCGSPALTVRKNGIAMVARLVLM